MQQCLCSGKLVCTLCCRFDICVLMLLAFVGRAVLRYAATAADSDTCVLMLFAFEEYVLEGYAADSTPMV